MTAIPKAPAASSRRRASRLPISTRSVRCGFVVVAIASTAHRPAVRRLTDGGWPNFVADRRRRYDSTWRSRARGWANSGQTLVSSGT